MFDARDTIVAIATPPGRGGIGVVRVSGPNALRIATLFVTGLRAGAEGEPALEPRRATFARLHTPDGAADHVVVTYFPAPRSYTGEEVVELSGHGSPVLLRSIVRAAMNAGARLAEPGEFTLRAFLHGRIDLVQAEAVRDLVDAVTPLQARAAYDQLEGTLTAEIGAIDRRLFDLVVRLEASLDFPEEGYHFIGSGEASAEIEGIGAALDALLATAARGRLVREGLHVAIAGKPNVGKSSVFNALAGTARAIVTEIPGTTRDLLTETIDVDGIPMTFVDTAGIRGGSVDPVEIEGIARAGAARAVAHAILVVLDRSRPLDEDDRVLLESTSGRPRVVAMNKADLPGGWSADSLAAGESNTVSISALRGDGIDALRLALARAASGEPTRDVPTITNLRHEELLRGARSSLAQAAKAAEANAPEEFVVADLNEARRRLEEVTGARAAEDVLREIFSRFCIGK